MRVFVYVVLSLTLLSTAVSFSQDADPTLGFLISNQPVNTISLSQMKSKLIAHDIEFLHPNFGKNKKYRGFKLRDVLDMGFGDKWEQGYTDAVFIALDGYESVSIIDKLLEPGAYIVFQDLDISGWELIDDKKANPGPFYIVWTDAEQSTQNEYPWPWQLAKINLVSFKDSYPKVYPKGAKVDSGAYKGYEIFKGRCVRCHSMNGEGGKVGPDLNATKSIITYRSEFMIKEFIKHPSNYRYTQMPNHPDLSDEDLDNLIRYFSYMNDNRE